MPAHRSSRGDGSDHGVGPTDGSRRSAAAPPFREDIDRTIVVHLEQALASFALSTTGLFHPHLSAEDERARLLEAFGSTLLDLRLNPVVFLGCAEALCVVLAADPTSLRAACYDAGGIIEAALARRIGLATHPKIEEAVAKLAANPKRVREEEMAAVVGLSRAHFGRVLRADTDLDYCSLRRAVTLRAALRDILTSDEQIKPIAHRLGFEHPEQLSREFREMFGVSPRQVRRVYKAAGVRPNV